MKEEEFKKIQKKLGLSNAQLADRLGITVRMVSLMRAGKKKVSDRTARQLDDILKLEGMSEGEYGLSPLLKALPDYLKFNKSMD